jgi:hypothetical protein
MTVIHASRVVTTISGLVPGSACLAYLVNSLSEQTELAGRHVKEQLKRKADIPVAPWAAKSVGRLKLLHAHALATLAHQWTATRVWSGAIDPIARPSAAPLART